jgi:hypothetical protein
VMSHYQYRAGTLFLLDSVLDDCVEGFKLG